MVDDITALNEIWKQIFSDEVKSGVIFKNGTCVVCRESDKDPRKYATDLMKNMGIVIPGSSHGDFVVHPLDKIPGWVVTNMSPILRVAFKRGKICLRLKITVFQQIGRRQHVDAGMFFPFRFTQGVIEKPYIIKMACKILTGVTASGQFIIYHPPHFGKK